MLTRRENLRNAALAGMACVLPSDLLQPFERSTLITRAIPKTGERLPIVGLGTSATFRAAAFGADSWGRFFLKYVAAHPAVTRIIPAASKPRHMLDNMGAAYRELPDTATRRMMEEVVDALPSA